MTYTFLSRIHMAIKCGVLAGGLLLLMGCKPIDKKDATVTQKVESDLTFTCIYEKDTLPPADPEADIWFKQARELEKVDKYKRDYVQIGELYRKAAERNHPKAMLNLSNLISYGKVPPLPGKGSAVEVWDIIQKIAKLNLKNRKNIKHKVHIIHELCVILAKN